MKKKINLSEYDVFIDEWKDIEELYNEEDEIRSKKGQDFINALNSLKDDSCNSN